MSDSVVATIALEQLEVTAGQPDQNLDAALHRTRRAFSNGADIVVLPELAISGYVVELELARRLAEPIDGRSVRAFGDIVASTAGLVIFGLCERAGDQLFNSVVAIGPDGVVLHYRKLHLFDKEKTVYTPGNTGLPVVVTPFGVIGICICYDLRFVEVMRILALQGADMVIAPAAWVPGFDKAVPVAGRTGHADSLLVQANLNQVAAVAVSQVSSASNHGAALLGGSVACDAYGQLICGPLSRTHPDAGMARVDLDAVRAARQRGTTIWPRKDRRTDVYSLNYLGTAR